MIERSDPPQNLSFLSLALAWARERPKRLKGRPKGAKGSQRDPKDTQKPSEGSQRKAKGTRKGARRSQSHTEGNQRRPREVRRTRSIFQTPDQPPQRTLCCIIIHMSLSLSLCKRLYIVCFIETGVPPSACMRVVQASWATLILTLTY